MRAKSAVIIRVASKFSSPAAGVRRRNLRTEAERRACAASGDGAGSFLTHGVVQNIQGLPFLFSRPRAGPGRRPGWAVAPPSGGLVQRSPASRSKFWATLYPYYPTIRSLTHSNTRGFGRTSGGVAHSAQHARARHRPRRGVGYQFVSSVSLSLCSTFFSRVSP